MTTDLDVKTRVPARDRLMCAAVELLAGQSASPLSATAGPGAGAIPASPDRIPAGPARTPASPAQDPAAVSTRAILERAGVTAPTLYHHFGDKDTLLETAAAEHFRSVVASQDLPPEPLPALEAVWDLIVAYGRSHPQCFDLLFGATRTRQAGVDIAEELCTPPLTQLALSAVLAVPVAAAFRSFLAGCIGTALMLIADPDDSELSTLSCSSRTGILQSVLRKDDAGAPRSGETYVSAAIALNATLQAASPQQLSEPELALFLQWLDRLSSPGSTGPKAYLHPPTIPPQTAGTKE